MHLPALCCPWSTSEPTLSLSHSFHLRSHSRTSPKRIFKKPKVFRLPEVRILPESPQHLPRIFPESPHRRLPVLFAGAAPAQNVACGGFSSHRSISGGLRSADGERSVADELRARAPQVYIPNLFSTTGDPDKRAAVPKTG